LTERLKIVQIFVESDSRTAFSAPQFLINNHIGVDQRNIQLFVSA